MLCALWAAAALATEPLPLDTFTTLIDGELAVRNRELRRLRRNWRDDYAPLVLELHRFSRPGQQRALWTILTEQTQPFDTPDEAWQWVWSRPGTAYPHYADFKASLYRRIDPRFRAYFDDPPVQVTIRLDEVRWGGVVRDGIPPLDQPATLSVEQADYLAPDDIVFGVVVNGEARAYPKRVLAWHELARDTLGGTELVAVYCTLCGAMVVYGARVDGTRHTLGTSGFLYRSNKLMYDAATSTLWSTLDGTPVAGPLVGMGIELPRYPVVTTQWGTWREAHPDTTVLAIPAMHERDYGEGVAYRDYFATDELMFQVPEAVRPKGVKNKDDVLVLPGSSPPAALAMGSLGANWQGEVPGLGPVLVVERGGFMAYRRPEARLQPTDDGAFVDADGRRFEAHDDGLHGPDGVLPRLPAHRAFWFGWRAAYPDGVLWTP